MEGEDMCFFKSVLDVLNKQKEKSVVFQRYQWWRWRRSTIDDSIVPKSDRNNWQQRENEQRNNDSS